MLAYHHPLAIAKRYGTLDLVCGGRLILGVGVGTLKEEFDLLGAPYDNRGLRGDDAMRALRASLSQARAGQSWRLLRFRGHGRRSLRVQETSRSGPAGAPSALCAALPRSPTAGTRRRDRLNRPDSGWTKWSCPSTST